nr:MAG TPA: DNA directed DNA polymerase [Caudoviricetes sp.]
MDVQEVLQRFDGVKQCGTGQYMARCPCHDDRKQSLSIGRGEKGVVLKCQAGCNTHDVIACVGIKPRDLFYNTESKPTERPQIVAVYEYPNGVQKLRKSDKSFSWRRPDGKGGWVYNRKGIQPSLYVAGTLQYFVFVVEGEKDADAVHRLGFDAVSGADGAGPGKWRAEYSEQLRGHCVCIFPDNDAVGKAYAEETAAALHGVADYVQLCDLSTVWPEIPEHGDISDLIAHFGDDHACEMITQLATETPEWTAAPPEADEFLSCFKTLEDFEEEAATWLVPGWIPEGQITLMAADGGIGKTTLWCNIIAAVSSGRRCILDPPEYAREPQRVAFLTTEDSVRKKLKRKLRLAGANMENIITPDFMADKSGALRDLKFGRPEMAKFVRYFRPALCVFDPVQGFVPPDINMGSRNAMRDCMAPLISLGEETGTTFLVVCHTNKRPKASGRDRIADSADLWDVSRSVLMAGYTEDQGVRYLSNEKNNYEQLQETLLFTIDEDGQARAEGTTWKRDREYTQDAAANTSAPKRDDCKEWLQQTLREAGGAMPSKDLEGKAKLAGFSFITLRRAKDELKKAGTVKFFTTGSAKDGNRVWHVQIVDTQQFTELPDETPTPWT